MRYLLIHESRRGARARLASLCTRHKASWLTRSQRKTQTTKKKRDYNYTIV